MNTDDPAWDAAASDRFNATFDRRAAEIDLMATFRRLLAEHGKPVVIDLPPGLDPTLRAAMLEESRTNPSVVVVDHGERGPRVMEIVGRHTDFRDALGRMEATFSAADTIADMAADAPDWPVYLPTPKRWPASPASSRTKAPKPPPEVQGAIMGKAADRNARKRINNLVSIGHSRECATRTVDGWAGDLSDDVACPRCQKGASNA